MQRDGTLAIRFNEKLVDNLAELQGEKKGDCVGSRKIGSPAICIIRGSQILSDDDTQIRCSR